MIVTAFCRVAGQDISMITDMEGCVTRVICTALNPRTSECRLKRRKSGDGPLAQLIEKTAEHRLCERGVRCHSLP